MHPSHIMTQREIIRNNLNKSDWEITKDKCDSTRAHRRHLAANGKHENNRKIYCTNVHLRIIEILITLMYKLSAVTAAVTGYPPPAAPSTTAAGATGAGATPQPPPHAAVQPGLQQPSMTPWSMQPQVLAVRTTVSVARATFLLCLLAVSLCALRTSSLRVLCPVFRRCCPSS